MSLLDLDRYYTPEATARELVEATDSVAARCLDTACGEGGLLKAAAEVIPGVACHGMDVDTHALDRLRRRYRAWVLSKGDALSPQSWSRCHAVKDCTSADLVLLNPPFSMATAKGLDVCLKGYTGRTSVAMAHVLSVVLRLEPSRAAAIVPESLIYSDLDAQARQVLEKRYALSVLRGLKNTTFKGTRANALLITLQLRSRPRRETSSQGGLVGQLSTATLVRGGLPLFEAKSGTAPLVHSTAIEKLRPQSIRRLPRVQPILRGVVSGHVLLIPRVGVPKPSRFHVIFARSPIQLSDCVFALCFATRDVGRKWLREIKTRGEDVCSLYRGTGARYVTVARLASWLERTERQAAKALKRRLP